MKKNRAKGNRAGKRHGSAGKGRIGKQYKPGINRNHKDRLFRLIFSDKAALLQLYNAIRGSNYEDPEELFITTNEDVIYMGMKNDLSFLIDDVLNLYEHQASFNPNMSLRGFFYLADSYRKFIEMDQSHFYGSKAVRLPVPQYLVFYNGTRKEPDRMELRLSDLFEKAEGIRPCVEVTAVMLNINRGHNRELMQKCRILWEYAELVGRIRENQRSCASLREAADRAVKSCIQEDILAKFLRAHRAEVLEVILTEFDEKGYIAYEKKLSWEDGKEEGRLECLIKMVCKKLAKGKTLSLIAEELEEDTETVAEICETAERFAPEYDCEKILSIIKEAHGIYEEEYEDYY